MDRLHEETQRTHQISDMNIKLGFLMSLSYLMDPSNNSNIAMKIHHFTDKYDDITSKLQREIHHLCRHIIMNEETTGKETMDWKAYEILQYVVKWGFEESFPNFIIPCTFLTMCVSVAACERSFSKLKLIKTNLRSTMSHSRFSNLAILSILSVN